MVYASSVHESSCFSTSRPPGSRTPSIIYFLVFYFQPMKQTRADMLGVLYVCIRLIIPHSFINTGRSEPCLASLLTILVSEGEGDIGMTGQS